VLELRHRQRARAEDRFRALKDSGLRNLPLHDLAQNQIWPAPGNGPPLVVTGTTSLQALSPT